MIFDGRTYSALVVSSSEKFNSSISSLFPNSTFTKVEFANNIADARRRMALKTYDFVIINAPLPDEFGTRVAIDVARSKNSVALLAVKSDQYDEINAKVIEHGVFTLPKPTSSSVLSQALIWMTSAREKLRQLESKSSTLEEKMEEIRLVNKAKWLLIDHLGMSENDAHKHIEKQAMNLSATKKEIALSVISTYS